jgi:endoribonuclease Nob1
MKAVLDSSFFFYDLPLEGDLFTTHSVCEELLDIRSKGRFEQFCALGLQIISPQKENTLKVSAAACKSGDTGVISDTDRDLLALALELDAVLYTDDFAIQNVANRLGVKISPMHQRKARKITWRYRCSGCGRYFDHAGECLVCGSDIKRKLK